MPRGAARCGRLRRCQLSQRCSCCGHGLLHLHTATQRMSLITTACPCSQHPPSVHTLDQSCSHVCPAHPPGVPAPPHKGSTRSGWQQSFLSAVIATSGASSCFLGCGGASPSPAFSAPFPLRLLPLPPPSPAGRGAVDSSSACTGSLAKKARYKESCRSDRRQNTTCRGAQTQRAVG